MVNIKTAFGAVTLSVLLFLVNAATFTPLSPPSYPLAVRSPYLSAWLPGSLASNLPSSSPQFWAGNDLTWSVIARVDGVAYNLFGVADPAAEGTKNATVTAGSFTSTHSIFTLTAGSRTITLDFFSPVSPRNYLRQSLPFSYLTVTVSGGSLSSGGVQIYSDIDDTWTGQSSDSVWSHSTNGTTGIYRISKRNKAFYNQNSHGQALWGEAVYASRPSDFSTLYSASGPSSTIRGQFISNGTLSNSHASWSPGGVTGFAHDLGTAIGETSVTFAIGHFRELAINYLGNAQTGFFRAKYPDVVAAVSHFLDDYEDAASESRSLDDLIQTNGESAYGANYSDILALSVRQVFGGIEITIPNDSLDTSDPQAFIKEISSNGNINTVDVIYATFPIFYVLNPDFINLLIKPVFKYQGSDAYTKEYAVHDLGMNYPNATGHLATGEEMPIEESGNIILLTYAYQRGTGNTDLATTYSSQLKQYANYLKNNGEYPASQLSLNDALGELANQTNLGIKAAVGLAAYGSLTSQDSYTVTGKSFAETIYTDRVGTDADGTYFTIQYGIEPWFLVFNHYLDRLFGLDVFPEEAYNATTAFYPTVRRTAGIPLHGTLGWGQTNWQSYVAATVEGEAREVFISDLHAYISNGINTAPFSDRYWVEPNGDSVAGQSFVFRARPTLGSHFALLALHGGANQWG